MKKRNKKVDPRQKKNEIRPRYTRFAHSTSGRRRRRKVSSRLYDVRPFGRVTSHFLSVAGVISTAEQFSSILFFFSWLGRQQRSPLVANEKQLDHFPIRTVPKTPKSQVQRSLCENFTCGVKKIFPFFSFLLLF
jgi:hypothetical protein